MLPSRESECKVNTFFAVSIPILSTKNFCLYLINNTNIQYIKNYPPTHAEG